MDIFLIILGGTLFAGRVGRLFFACITRSACFLCGFVAFALYGQNPFQYYTFDFMGFFGHYCPGDGLCDAHVGHKIQWRR